MNRYEKEFHRRLNVPVAIEKVKGAKRKGHSLLVASTYYRDDETGENQVGTNWYSAEDVLTEVLEFHQDMSRSSKIHLHVPDDDWYFGPYQNMPRTFKDLIQEMGELLGNDPTHLETPQQYEERRCEEKRKKLECEARRLAAKYKVEVNSPQFLDACMQELERLDSYREGMREDGLCIGWGVTPEQWQDEFNESQGDSSQVHEIMNWISQYLPLLFARWASENQAAGD